MGKRTITPEKMAAYRTAAQQRDLQKYRRIELHYQRGLKVAQQSVVLLKQNFQVERVVLFGSMRSQTRVHERSDLDLAVWGLNPQEHYRAVGQLLALDPGIPVDVVLFESASLQLQTEILETGIPL